MHGILSGFRRVKHLRFAGSHKQEGGRAGDLGIGAATLTDQDQSSSAISNNKYDGITIPRYDWLHGDVQKFSNWLI
jgi:hypothetical protein